MHRAVDTFVRQAEGADIALFYFSGHGVQLFDRNFLVARDASVGIRELEDLGIDLTGLIARLRTAGPVRSALLIDACRDNPFGFDQTTSLLDMFRAKRAAGPAAATATSPPTRGLAPVAVTANAPVAKKGQVRRGAGETLLYFAAQPGAVSFDGEGQNSYFVEGINDALAKGDQPFGEVLRQASAYVRTATAGKQVPQIVSDWTTDVSLETRDLVRVDYDVNGQDGRKPTGDERTRLIEDASSFTKLHGDFLVSASLSPGGKDDAIAKLGFVHGFSLAYDFDRDGSEDKLHVGFQQTSLYMLYESSGVTVHITNCLDGSPGAMQVALKDLDGDRVPEVILGFTTENDETFGEFCILKLQGIERLNELRRAKLAYPAAQPRLSELCFVPGPARASSLLLTTQSRFAPARGATRGKPIASMVRCSVGPLPTPAQ